MNTFISYLELTSQILAMRGKKPFHHMLRMVRGTLCLYCLPFCILLAFCLSAKGQGAKLSYDSLNKGKEFSFPVFKSASGSGAADRINKYLQLSELEILPDNAHKQDIFSHVQQDEGTIYGGKQSISFDILHNDASVLSLRLDESSCGITCAYWNRYYNFNPGNGDIIHLADLFTAKGFDAFKALTLKKRTSEFKQQADTLRPAARDNLDYVFSALKDDDLDDYYINGTSIFIDGWNLLTKNDKFSELDMTVEIPLSAIRNDLNDYGRTVFGLTHDAIGKYSTHQISQLYEGTIGTQKIVMILRQGSGSDIDAIYAYVKHGVGISLHGELHGKTLTLTESSKEGEDAATIEATADDGQIKGTWTNKDKSRTLKLEVHR